MLGRAVPHLPPWTGPLLLLAGYAAIVALLTGYTHWIWRRRAAAPLTRDAAADLFRRELDGGEVREVLLLADGRTALVRTDAGELAVVGASGRGCTARLLRREDVRGVRRHGASSVRLRLRDYAHPMLALSFPSPEAEAAWLAPVLERRG